ARLLENSALAALRRTVISAMRDLILNAGDAKGNVVPSSVREVRKLALELVKLSKQGDLRDCFQEHDLEYLDFYGVTFSGERLAGMSFRGSFLVEAAFRRSDLIRASFAGAYLRNADFAEADLSGVNLTDA